MFTPECVYWIPSTPTGGDPRKEIAITFDDRRRLEDRVYRLRTGYAWSQKPKSRTVRMVSNVEVFDAGRTDTRMVRSNVDDRGIPRLRDPLPLWLVRPPLRQAATADGRSPRASST